MSHVELLKTCGLKATPQRLCILKVLDRHEHPSIEDLYEVNAPNKKSRYDIYQMPHIHVVCEKCGNVEDLFMDDAFNKDVLKNIERKAGNFIRKLNITATVEDCEKCR